jgi:hypothetical protein
MTLVIANGANAPRKNRDGRDEPGHDAMSKRKKRSVGERVSVARGGGLLFGFDEYRENGFDGGGDGGEGAADAAPGVRRVSGGEGQARHDVCLR